jgi:RNA polymerase sigma-70 factor (ECF subfamily)
LARFMTEDYETLQPYNPDLLVSDEFERLTSPFQHELLVHCYRFFGSLDEAEDALQETWLRAWRRIGSLREQSALRAWLYKIATNVSLDMLDRRKARSLPNLVYPPADPQQPLPSAVNEPIWIDPLPDEYLDWHSLNLEARYELRESVSLAFLTVLQLLPGRQRAILILRDVLGWKAQETAELLGLSVPAVNSALQRARATLKKHHQDPTLRRPGASDKHTETLLDRYVRAWETADSKSLVSLLREDAIWTMPPLPAWYRGRMAIKEFLDRHLFIERLKDSLHLVAARANGCPAFVAYQLEESGEYRAGALQILKIEQDEIIQIDSYLTPDSKLLARFKLPVSYNR